MGENFSNLKSRAAKVSQPVVYIFDHMTEAAGMMLLLPGC